MSRFGSFDPTDLEPSEELSARSLELLKAGKVKGEFAVTAYRLMLRVGEPDAVMEGSLLYAGGDLEEIAKAGCHPDKDPAVERFKRDRRLFAFLRFAEISANKTGQIRPIGREILQHCLLLSTDSEATTILNRIREIQPSD